MSLCFNPKGTEDDAGNYECYWLPESGDHYLLRAAAATVKNAILSAEASSIFRLGCPYYDVNKNKKNRNKYNILVNYTWADSSLGHTLRGELFVGGPEE